MRRYVVTPFRASHVASITYTPEALVGFVGQPMTEALAQGLTRYPSITLWREGHVLLCAGMVLPHAARGELWCCMDVQAQRYPVAVGRQLAHALWQHIEALKLNRVALQVREKFDAGRTLAEWLGLSYEAHLHAYGPQGDDYLQYVWVRSS